jgi:polysaccharide pyruvyl transferase WcaK-like protein
MTLSKKINKTLKFVTNELTQSLSSFRGPLPMLYPLPAFLNLEKIQKSEGRIFIHSDQIDQLFNSSEIESRLGQNSIPIHLIVALNNELDFQTGNLLKFFSKANSEASFNFLFRGKIQNKEDWSKTEDFFIQFINEISLFIGKCNFTFEVNGGNFLYADDIRGFMLKYQVPNVCYLPHVSYFQPKEGLIQVKELFHVRMFFDALTRDKAWNFSWRNYYREFAAQSISLENSGWKYLSLNDFGINKTSEVNNLIIPSDGLFIHEQLIRIGFNPAIGIAKVSELISHQITGKIFRSSNDFKFKPVEDPKAQSGKGLDVKSWKRVLITGWYGTETQGDKAILGEVLHFIKSASPNCKIVLTTLHHTISEQTKLELDDLKGVELVHLEKSFEPSFISRMDAVIVGGGPLMESASMKYIGYIFAEAYKQRISRVIFGCGIGPIHSIEVEKITRYMLSVCNAGFVRDEESFNFAGRLFPNHVLKFACDPAVGFVSRWRKTNQLKYNTSIDSPIATLLRANTNEFSPDSNPESLRFANEGLACKAAEALFQISQKTSLTLALLHMNAPWVGGDDRIYNRILSSQFPNGINYTLVREYLTLNEHLILLSQCKGGLAMRYHGHIFCMAMGIPFISLDYTGKSGKVSSLVNRIAYDKWSVQWNNIQPDSMSDEFFNLLENGESWSKFLVNEADKLVKLLHQTYIDVFHYCPEN